MLASVVADHRVSCPLAGVDAVRTPKYAVFPCPLPGSLWEPAWKQK